MTPESYLNPIPQTPRKPQRDPESYLNSLEDDTKRAEANVATAKIHMESAGSKLAQANPEAYLNPVSSPAVPSTTKPSATLNVSTKVDPQFGKGARTKPLIRGNATAAVDPGVSLGTTVPNLQDIVTQARQSPAANTPEAQLRANIRDQVIKERGNLPVGMSLSNPAGSDENYVAQQTNERVAAAERSKTPEMITARQEFGAMPVPVRAIGAPAQRFGAGVVKMLGGIAGLGGMTPNHVSDYLNKRGAVLEEAASLPPLNAQGEEIVRGLPEKAASAVADLGFSIVGLVALKKATGRPLGQVMAAETALKTSDLPLNERTAKVAEAYAMGRILDQHLSRTASAAIFGLPTAVETGGAVARGDMKLEDALLQTGIQAGSGFVLGGKPGTNRVSDALLEAVHGKGVRSGTAKKAVDPAVEEMVRTGAEKAGVGANAIENAVREPIPERGPEDQGAILAAPRYQQKDDNEPVHHSQLQPRTEEGKFDGPPIVPERRTSTRTAENDVTTARKMIEDRGGELYRLSNGTWDVYDAQGEFRHGITDAELIDSNREQVNAAQDIPVAALLPVSDVSNSALTPEGSQSVETKAAGTEPSVPAQSPGFNWETREEDGEWKILNPDGKEVLRVADRNVAAQIVQEMRNQPTEAPGVSLSQAVRAAGGIKPGSESGGEWQDATNKESGTTGVVNRKSGRNDEELAQRLAEDGYGIGDWAHPTEGSYSGEAGKGTFDIDIDRFREAVKSDLNGSHKSYTTEAMNNADAEAAYRKQMQSEQDEHDADATDSLLTNEGTGVIYDKIANGTATPSEVGDFKRQASELGISPEGQSKLIASAREAGVQEAPEFQSETTGSNPDRVTSVKNATTTAERAERGLDPVEKELARGDDEVWSKAKRDVDNGIVDPDKLAAEVSRKPRPLDEDETAALLYRRTQLHNQREAQMGAAEEAIAKGDKIKAAQHNLDLTETERLLGVNEEADVRAGQKQGRAFRIRQLMAKQDFSLGAMERRARVARGGDLSATDKATIKEQHDQIAKLTTELEKIKKDQEFQLTSDAVRKIVRDEKFAARGQRRATTRKALDDDFETIKKQLAAVWKKKPDSGIHPMGLAALDPEGVATKLVLKLAKNRIQAGHVTAEGLVDAVHEKIADAVDLTKREVAEMISGYGKTSKPSDDAIDKKFRELKSIIASNLGKADVLEKGIAPARRGYQRDKPTLEMRKAERELRDAMREQGVKIERSARSPEEQQKSALDRMKTVTRNQIEDLDAMLKAGKRIVRGKSEKISDDELKTLQSHRDSLKELVNALKDPEADNKAIANSLRGINKSIEDMQAKLKAGPRAEPKEGMSSPWSEEISAARKTQAELGRANAEMRKADDSWYAQAKRTLTEHKALNTRLGKQEAEYQRRIDEIKRTGKPYEAPGKKEPFARTAAERIIEERVQRLKQQFEADNRKASQTWGDWVGRLFVGTGRAAKLTYTATLGKLSSAAAGRILTSPVEDAYGRVVGAILPDLYKGAAAEGPGSTPGAATVARDIYGGPKGAGLLNDHLAGIERLWKSDTWREVVNKLVRGKSQQDVLYGKGQHESEFLGIPGQVHGAFKEPVRQVTFYRQFRRRLGAIAREGKLDIHDPSVQMGAAIEGWNDAARSIFQQRNFLSDWFNRNQRNWQFEGGGLKPGIGRSAVKIGGVLAGAEFPITRVPVNIATEGLNYTLGSVRALGETGYRILKNRGLNGAFDEMTPEQKDSLMRAYKKGGVGLAMGVWGLLQPHNFGGYFQKGDKRDKNEPGFGEMMFFGHRVPAAVAHGIPVFWPAQMGATFRRMIDVGAAKGNKDAVIEAAGGTTKAALSQIPFYETPGRFFAGIEGPRQASRFFGEQVRGFVPGAVQEYAKYRDKGPEGEPVRRTPQGSFKERFKQTIDLGIPGLRETVPISSIFGNKVTKASNEVQRLKLDIKGATRQPDETPEEFAKREASDNEIARKAIERITSLKAYDRLNDAGKAKQIKLAKQRALNAIERPEKQEKPEEPELLDEAEVDSKPH